MYFDQIIISPDHETIRVQFNLKTGRKVVRFLSSEFSVDQVQRWATVMLSIYSKS